MSDHKQFSTTTSINSTNDDNDADSDGFELLPLPYLVPVAVVTLLVMVVAVTANLLVLLSYCLDFRLRTVSSLYLLHLAICDLLLALISMPFYLMYNILQQTWPLGKVFCKVYLINDYTLCAMSVYLVVLITWDILLILRKGVRYSTEETKHRAYVKITIAWILAILIYTPAIIGWDYWTGYSIIATNDCGVEFYNNKIYTIVTAVLEFFLPGIVLIILNWEVYKEVRKRIKVSVAGIGYHTQRKVWESSVTGKSKEKQDTKLTSRNDGVSTTQSSPRPDKLPFAAVMKSSTKRFNDWVFRRDGEEKLRRDPGLKIDPEKNYVVTQSWLPEADDGNPTTCTYIETTNKTLTENGPVTRSPLSPNCGASESAHRIVSNSSHWVKIKNRLFISHHTHKFTKKLRSDLRAARALAIFMFAFFIFWAPYTIATAVIAVCEDCVNKDAYKFFTWLLWTKSAVDPFLYATGNPRFKTNFVKILNRVCFCCWRKQKQ